MGKIYTALGLMSGTSMDGVDLSLIKSDGNNEFLSILDDYCEFDDELKEKLIKLKKKISYARDEIINILLKKGIEVRNCFYPIHLMNPYKKYHSKKNNLEKSIELSKSIIALPSSVNLGDKEIKNICANLNLVLRKFDL